MGRKKNRSTHKKQKNSSLSRCVCVFCLFFYLKKPPQKSSLKNVWSFQMKLVTNRQNRFNNFPLLFQRGKMLTVWHLQTFCLFFFFQFYLMTIWYFKSPTDKTHTKKSNFFSRALCVRTRLAQVIRLMRVGYYRLVWVRCGGCCGSLSTRQTATHPAGIHVVHNNLDIFLLFLFSISSFLFSSFSFSFHLKTHRKKKETRKKKREI